MRRASAAAAAILVAFASVAHADAGDASPIAARVRAARTKSEREAAVAAGLDALKSGATGVAELAAALSAPRRYEPGLPTGWLRKTVTASDGVTRPWLLHVPARYDPAKAYRLVVEMHGGVSRPRTLTHEELEGGGALWGETAEREEWLLAVPAGQQGCVWWDEVGSAMVLDILRETKRTYHVDENAVFATGFSDGGSGTWYLAAARPTGFAGFVPLSGHVSVAGMAGLQIHARSFLNRPVYATNTDLDSLYPSAGLKPVFEAFSAIGAPVLWRDIPGFGHDPRYLAAEEPAVLTWMSKQRRDTASKTLVWEGADGAPSRVDWLRVTSVTGGSGVGAFPDVNPLLTETRIRIGVQVDQEFAGKGVRITGVVEGSPAEAMKLAAGDVLTDVDGAPVASFADLRRALSKKKPGDDVSVRALRGAESVEAKTKLPAAQTEPAFRRTKPFGSIRAEIRDNAVTVTCAGIGAFEIFVSPRTVDMAKPVTVTVNGGQAFSGVVAAEPAFLLAQAAEDDDPSLVYHAKIAVTVPAPAR